VKSFLLVLAAVRHSGTRALVKAVLESAGHRVVDSGDYLQAHSLFSNGLNPDLVLIEGGAGTPSEKADYLRLLKAVRHANVCVIAGHGDTRVREEARGLGIGSFLMKPVTRRDLESKLEMLRNPAAGVADVRVECTEAPGAYSGAAMNTCPLPLIEELGDNRYFLAASPSMLEIHRQARLLADIDVTVLILGESGTGKEVIANLIHRYSRRSRQKLLNVNCAALPAELLESELFGHQQGAFTGAVKDRAGRFEQANHGTLLLDEIGEISAQMQAKLLHVLQDGQFTRLGGQESTRVDVRILAATNVEMEAALRDKSFREDLYYRLSAFTIHVPPLRERREEIPFLIEETIRRTPAEMRSGGEYGFSSRLMDVALAYEWRGNLRELRNFVTRTIIMRDQDAAVRELETRIAARNAVPRMPAVEAGPAHVPGMRSVVRELKDRTEMQMIQEALDASGWNRRHAAQSLNISYRALLYKIQQHRLSPKMAGGVN
jgi:two-component system, NtrC family, response regulator AtoC